MVVGRDVETHPISIGRDHPSARRLLFLGSRWGATFGCGGNDREDAFLKGREGQPAALWKQVWCVNNPSVAISGAGSCWGATFGCRGNDCEDAF
jgi:hypothetical protein